MKNTLILCKFSTYKQVMPLYKPSLHIKDSRRTKILHYLDSDKALRQSLASKGITIEVD